MPKEGLQTTYSFIYGAGYDYMIPRPKGSKFGGDIVIGGGLTKGRNEGILEYGTTDDTSMDAEIIGYLTETTPEYFGSSWGDDDDDGRIRKRWTGIMGISNDGCPFIGEVPGEEDLWIAASFQGHGMVLCFLCAKALVSFRPVRRGWERSSREFDLMPLQRQTEVECEYIASSLSGAN
jgi:glycine/D-amino acid oxidase-like deaminating enzyme